MEQKKPLADEPEKIYTLYEDWFCYSVCNCESLKTRNLPFPILASDLMYYLVSEFGESVENDGNIMSSYNICLIYPFQDNRMHIGILADTIRETDLLKKLKSFSEGVSWGRVSWGRFS